MMRVKGLLCWWCCGSFDKWKTGKPEGAEEMKDTSAVSEPNQHAGDEFDHMNQLRAEVKQIMSRRISDPKPALEVEDVVVGVDYLPVYKEQSGKLSFIGIKMKIAFTEERRKKTSIASTANSV